MGEIGPSAELDLALIEMKVSAETVLDALRLVLVGLTDLAGEWADAGRLNDAAKLIEIGERGIDLLRPLLRDEPEEPS